ncbi:MAG: CDP-alcohol phosphatidyltransferase family protein [Dehalococcoidia bacterium]|nr:CDP-alcohol phosphatidyltransferase family protein [Dehalococcoidia bacterium]
MKSKQTDNQASENELRLSLNVPNIITAVRVVLAGIIVWLLWQGEFFAAGTLIVIAAATDGLDGLLARRLGQSSLGGSLFDLVADQILFMPSLILATAAGLFSKADGLMPFNPYPYVVFALAGGVTVLAGVGTFLWKRRTRALEFPTPTGVAKLNFWFWLAPLVVAVFGIGPGWLLAVLMYLAIISTALSFYSYLKKGSYVFTD